MALGRAALGAGQIIPAVAIGEVRALDPDGPGAEIHAPVHQHGAGPVGSLARDVEFLDPDGSMAFVFGRALRRAVVQDPGLTLGIDEQRGIDGAFKVGQPDGIAPRPGRVGRGNQEIAAAVDAGVQDVEQPGMMLDGRGEDASGQAKPGEIQLVGSVDRIADLGPVDQVLAVKDRDSREVGEGRGDQVEVVSDPGHRRVGIEACQDRVAVLARRKGHRRRRIAALIGEGFEARRRGLGQGRPGKQRCGQTHGKGKKVLFHLSDI